MFKIKNQIKDSFFDDINGVKLDKYQRKAIICDSKELLVIASAGSGKTLTIIGKIKYLIEKKNVKEDEILCLSFTNETVNNLKEKVKYNIDIFTFHKLSLNILKENNYKYYISDDNLLEYIVNEYFLINDNETFNYLREYFNDKIDFNSNKFKILKLNILSYIKKIKCNDINQKLIRKKIRNISSKDKIFLIFVFNIYKIYMEELNSTLKIDFDDMIIYARNLVKKYGIKKKYRYIIIDEYQDISLIRFKLIKEIINKLKANIMCVGDDYQSIYGFSGSNINLFTNFFKYFPSAKRIDIKNTYRNGYELINITNKFIMKNHFQLKKDIHANFLIKYPIVLVYYEDYKKTYNNLINYLYLEDKKNIMVLARYNKDLLEIKTENKGMNIRYLTVHKSKGLESDNVILLKMSDDYLGFPSKIKDDFLFINNNEKIDYAEERRLFYVALTRTKERIYILVPKSNPSIFIEEIKNKCAILEID